MAPKHKPIRGFVNRIDSAKLVNAAALDAVAQGPTIYPSQESILKWCPWTKLTGIVEIEIHAVND